MIRREVELLFNALRFFTRMPVPRWVGHSTELLNHAARYFPLVGWLVALIGAAAFLVTGMALPVTLAIVLSMAATIRFTGAFHEDGFGDVCDGFGGGWDRAQTLAIMKDSRIGAYGAIGLVVMLLAKFLALLEMGEELVPIALLVAHPLSRFASTTLIYALDYAREDQPDEIARAKPLAHRLSGGELACAGLFGCLPLLLLSGLEAIGVRRAGIRRHAVGRKVLSPAYRRLHRRLPGRHPATRRTRRLPRAEFLLAAGRDGGTIELHLIRHPRTIAPAGICYGATDLALADDPRDAAERLRALLPARYTLASSPATRCLQLAQQLGPTPRIDARLAEIDFGEWEMQAFDTLPRAAIDAWAADPFGFRPPGGETANEMTQRVLDALTDLMTARKRGAGHRRPRRAAARDCRSPVAGLPRSAWLATPFDYARATRIDIAGGYGEHRLEQSLMFARRILCYGARHD